MKMHILVANIIRDAHVELGNNYIFDNKIKFTWWTRGDGSRYKDMNQIDPRGYGKSVEKTFVDEFQASNWMWDRLEDMSPKHLWVRDEFPSNGYRKAVIYRGLVFIKNPCIIEYATKSVLNNDSVWHSKPREKDA